MLPDRFSEIDDLTRGDHYYLRPDDICYYLGEYTARKGYRYSYTNQLITNLKISPQLKNTGRWYYKNRAITEAGRAIRGAINNDNWIEDVGTFVPIPPSKSKDDVEYDDRMVRIPQSGFAGLDHDIRELVLQTKSTPADHESDDRLSPEELKALYYIDEDATEPTPTRIVVIDDVLTTGKHFVVAKDMLQSRFPEVPIIGIFVARVVHDADFDMFFDNLNEEGA